MSLLLDGLHVREVLSADLATTIRALDTQPTLVIFQVGNRLDSTSYINQKKKFAEKIGVRVVHEHFSESVSQQEVQEYITKANADKGVHGIIVQIPLPMSLNKNEVIETIDPKKDVDGLTSTNVHLLEKGLDGIIPATARGVLSLLDFYTIEIKGKKVVVVGRSALVGRPVALALEHRGAIVSVGHNETEDLKSLTRTADILVVAIGDPEFITEEYLIPGQTIIDIGITAIEKNGERKIVGDVNADAARTMAGAYTPVPGGVGPLTVLSLFQNLVQAYNIQTL